MAKEYNPIVISPNPTEGIFNISTIAKMSKVSIHDNLGVLVFESKTEGTNEQIDLSQLPKGMYFVSLLLENNQEVHRKLLLR